VSQAAAAGRTRGGLLLVLAGLGVFFAADDQTSVVAILPAMIDDAGLAQDQFYRAAWIVNGYILGYVVAMPLMGRVADVFGRTRVYALALCVFVVGSAWVALSSELAVLSIGRGVQAVGAGAVVPVSMAIVVSAIAPERRALGLGAIAAASEAGGLIGPLWGGGIADLIGWRGVFWINLPLCLPIALAIWRLGPPPAWVAAGRLDLAGALLLGLSLVCLTVGLTDDPIEPRPLAASAALFTLAAVLFALFILRERLAPAPLVSLALFRRPALSAGVTVNALAGGTLIVAMVGVPLYTNVVLAGSALDGGLNLMRLSVGLPAGALAGGVLSGRIGCAPAAALGLLLAGVGFLGMAGWQADPAFLALTLPLLCAGFGFGVLIAPVHAAVLGEAGAADRATVAALLTVVRLLGALVGVALLTTQGLGDFYAAAGRLALDDPRFVEQVRGLEVDSFQRIFLVAALVCFATIGPALFLGGRPRRSVA